MTPLLITLAIFAFTLPLPIVLQLLIAAVLPLLVGLVTNRVTAAAKKAILLLVLSIVAAGLNDLLTSVKADRPFDAGLWLVAAVGTFLASGAFHLVLWKPTGVAAAAQDAIPSTQSSDQKQAEAMRTGWATGGVVPGAVGSPTDDSVPVLTDPLVDVEPQPTQAAVVNPHDLDGNGRDDTTQRFVSRAPGTSAAHGDVKIIKRTDGGAL